MGYCGLGYMLERNSVMSESQPSIFLDKEWLLKKNAERPYVFNLMAVGKFIDLALNSNVVREGY